MTCMSHAEGPGGLILQALKGLTPLVRKLGPKANPGNLKNISKVSLGIGAFTVGVPPPSLPQGLKGLTAQPQPCVLLPVV